MSDNLFERLTDLSIGTGSQTPLAAIDRIEKLEAKLAKAVEALVQMVGKNNYADDPWEIASATLAELKADEP